jgi:hypothetical protein
VGLLVANVLIFIYLLILVTERHRDPKAEPPAS